MQCSFPFEKWSKAKRLIFNTSVIMKFKVLCFNDARVMQDTDPTRSSIQLAMADGVSASSSSEDEREKLFIGLPKQPLLELSLPVDLDLPLVKKTQRKSTDYLCGFPNG